MGKLSQPCFQSCDDGEKCSRAGVRSCSGTPSLELFDQRTSWEVHCSAGVSDRCFSGITLLFFVQVMFARRFEMVAIKVSTTARSRVLFITFLLHSSPGREK